MTMQSLTAATSALTAAADAYNGKKQEIDAALQSFTASVNAGIRDAMRYVATVDPDLEASNVAQKQFKTLAEMFAQVPAGADLEVRIPAGKTVVLNENYNIRTSLLRFLKTGSGDNPVIHVQCFVDNRTGSPLNRWNCLIGQNSAAVWVDNVDVVMAPRVDPGLGIDGLFMSFLRARRALAPLSLSAHNSRFSYAGPPGEVCVARLQAGEMLIVGLYAVEFDGLVVSNGFGSSSTIFVGSNITLKGGATFLPGGEDPAESQRVISANFGSVTEIL